MNKSESIKELATALNKAQNEMGGAIKDANNPFFKSKYADLGSVVKAIKEPFANNGLSYSQFPITDGDRVGIDTILMHSSGEWLSQSFTVKLTKQDAQGAGSAITYCRRYGLQAIAGVPSEDDDGQAASKQPSKPKGFTVDATAQQWIDAAKQDSAVLGQIEDLEYRKFIEGEL
tara:strand:+ start:23149 stop:23670 length:522 start_codon:yes stop_codon:yes gene_type:complete